jgi:hypothetical protein
VQRVVGRAGGEEAEVEVGEDGHGCLLLWLCVDVVVREEEVRPARARRCAPSRATSRPGRLHTSLSRAHATSAARAWRALPSHLRLSGISLPAAAAVLSSVRAAVTPSQLRCRCSPAAGVPRMRRTGRRDARGALPPHRPFLRSMTGGGRGGHTVHPRLSLICGGGCQAQGEARRGKTKAALRCGWCWSVSVLRRACRAAALRWRQICAP